MKEQSHKDEMSAAIRGDFRRLRERGAAATFAPPDEDVPATAIPAIETRAEAAPVKWIETRPGRMARLFGRR